MMIQRSNSLIEKPWFKYFSFKKINKTATSTAATLQVVFLFFGSGGAWIVDVCGWPSVITAFLLAAFLAREEIFPAERAANCFIVLYNLLSFLNLQAAVHGWDCILMSCTKSAKHPAETGFGCNGYFHLSASMISGWCTITAYSTYTVNNTT